MDELSVDDLMGIRLARSQFNHELYKELLRRCHDKIIWAARMGFDRTCYYIRPVQFDKPLINTRNAYNYIKDKLETGGFTVSGISDGYTFMLTIVWPTERMSMLKQWADHRRVNQPGSNLF